MTSVSLRLPAPAKLNLFLHVTGRCDDGYHTLESVFTPISLADTIELTRRDDGRVCLLDPPAGLDEQNDLACRAARALQAASKTLFGVDIRLLKCIPQGGGLGGGSSDAATTLLGLNRLWRLGLTRSQLMALALPLGADVPFFVFGRPAWVCGIGEQMSAVTVPAMQAVVASPGIGVATASVFTHPGLRRDTPLLKQRVLPVGQGRNDLQPIAAGLESKIPTLIEKMENLGASAVRMTGSGSCVFALTASVAQAATWRANLRTQGYDCWQVGLLPRHPLLDFCNNVIM